MRRGTTPTHVFRVKADLNNLEALYVTYQQHKVNLVEKTLDDVTVDTENNTVTVQLTQADTLKFDDKNCTCPENMVKIQIRWRYTDGNAAATKVLSVRATEILKDGEI